MARPLQQIQEEIRELSVADKEALLRLLWEELDGPADGDVDAAWLNEAKRRDAELDAGLDDTMSADDVFRSIEAAIGK
jgi:hypothetical protein